MDPTAALLDYLRKAVDYAGGSVEYATSESALRWLLELAWHDLQAARRAAINGIWSIDCDDQVSRIIGLTRLVGTCPWEKIQIDLLLDGIYEHIHAAIGTPTPLSDEDRRRIQALAEETDND